MHVGPDLFSTCMYSWNQQVLSEGQNSLDQMVHVYILLAQPVSNIKSEAWIIFRLLFVVTKLLCCVHSLVTSRRDGSTSDQNRGFDTTRGVDLKSSDCLHIFFRGSVQRLVVLLFRFHSRWQPIAVVTEDHFTACYMCTFWVRFIWFFSGCPPGCDTEDKAGCHFNCTGLHSRVSPFWPGIARSRPFWIGLARLRETGRYRVKTG